MNNVVSQSSVLYAYSLGNVNIKSISKSNIVSTDIRRIDLHGKKYVSNDFFKPNDIITFTILISNFGNYEATDIVVHDNIKNLEIVCDSIVLSSLIPSSCNFKHTIKDNTLIFEIDSIKEKEVLIINYKAKVLPISTDKELCSFATIYSKETKPYATNETSLIQKIANITCSKKAMSDFIYLNTEMIYEITIKNEGNICCSDLEVIDELPLTFELSTEEDAVMINGTAVSVFIFDNDKHILKIFIDYLSPNEEKKILVKGRIIK